MESEQGPTALIRGWFMEKRIPSSTDYLVVEQRGFVTSALGLLSSPVLPWLPENAFLLCENAAREHIPDESIVAGLTWIFQGW